MPTRRSENNTGDRQSPRGAGPAVELNGCTSPPPQGSEAGRPTRTCETTEGSALPERYGRDIITLMFQDPFTLYCYWEVTPETLASRHRLASDTEEYIVRVHPDDGAHFDVGVRRTVGSSYISLEKGGGIHFVELGLRGADGTFVPLLCSNSVVLPPVSVSDVEDHRWAGAGGLFTQSPRSNGLGESRPESFCPNSYSSYDLSSASLAMKKKR